jgi:hypothetical protein
MLDPFGYDVQMSGFANNALTVRPVLHKCGAGRQLANCT